jgi:hypothetical protein
VGPYSTIGITRYLGDTSDWLAVKGLTAGSINPNRITYYGVYTQTTPGISEPVYEYQYCLYEEYKKEEETIKDLIEDSGWLIPKRNNDGNREMVYTIATDLEYFKNYILSFTIKTVNGYQTSVDY